MKSAQFNRFTKPNVLKQVGRELLKKLFEKFKDQLGKSQDFLFDDSIEDETYFSKLAFHLMAPEGWPGDLNEVLHAIEEMATDVGIERLEKAVEDKGIKISFADKSSHFDIAIQVYLANPLLFFRAHNENRMLELTSFKHFIARNPKNRQKSFSLPKPAVIDKIKRHLNNWFAEHKKGEDTVQLDIYPLGDEYWILIARGERYARVSKVENGRTQLLQFRPTKDEVVVYSPAIDEIRINAQNVGEQKLYKEAFGLYFFDDADYFSPSTAYTLEPLKIEGRDCLDVNGIKGIREVKLREVELHTLGQHHHVQINKVNDIFAYFGSNWAGLVEARGVEIRRAVFEFFFEGTKKSRKVQIRLPNILKVGRHCDIRLVNQWISKRGFRKSIGKSES